MCLLHYFVIFLLSLFANSVADVVPMVAFKCGKPARYMTDEGWTQISSDCLTDPYEILHLCQQAYPLIKVTNIAESIYPVIITDWCANNETDCNPNQHTVTAFRCLATPFQSEALLVPSHCIFDHIHNENECKASSDWRPAAAVVCEQQQMKLLSSAPISVCGVGHFQGLEFVCCPQHLPMSTDGTTIAQTVTSFAINKTTGAQELMAENQVNIHYYKSYMLGEAEQFNSEHDYYMVAKQALYKQQQQELSQLLKQWSDAQQMIGNTQSENPLQTTNEFDIVNNKFALQHQKLVNEHKAQRRELLSMHQQRVQTTMDNKRSELFSLYMQSLNTQDVQAEKVIQALKHYIRIEQKDRQHSAQYYNHLKDVDSEQAASIRSSVIEHLKLVDKRLQQSIALLISKPDVAGELAPHIEIFLKKFSAIDEMVKKLYEDITSISTQITPMESHTALYKELEENIDEVNKASSDEQISGRSNFIAHHFVNELGSHEAKLLVADDKKVWGVSKTTLLTISSCIAGMLLLVSIAAIIMHHWTAKETVTHTAASNMLETGNSFTNTSEGFENPSCSVATTNEISVQKLMKTCDKHEIGKVYLDVNAKRANYDIEDSDDDDEDEGDDDDDERQVQGECTINETDDRASIDSLMSFGDGEDNMQNGDHKEATRFVDDTDDEFDVVSDDDTLT